jgi:hypothetical protein
MTATAIPACAVLVGTKTYRGRPFVHNVAFNYHPSSVYHHPRRPGFPDNMPGNFVPIIVYRFMLNIYVVSPANNDYPWVKLSTDPIMNLVKTNLPSEWKSKKPVLCDACCIS